MTASRYAPEPSSLTASRSTSVSPVRADSFLASVVLPLSVQPNTTTHSTVTTVLYAGPWRAWGRPCCLLNFRQCRETHCAITGPGWALAALLGLAAVLAPGSALSWYGVTGEGIAAIAICVLGYGVERAAASRTGSLALRKD